MRRSKVTLLFSRLTCSVHAQPYRPYYKPDFLALIPPPLTSLNPFVTFFRPLQPHFSSHNWGKYKNSRFNSRGGGYSHTLPVRVCAAQRGRDFEGPIFPNFNVLL